MRAANWPERSCPPVRMRRILLAAISEQLDQARRSRTVQLETAENRDRRPSRASPPR